MLTYVELTEEAEPTATRGHISCLDSSDEYQREEEQATLWEPEREREGLEKGLRLQQDNEK